MVVRQETVQPIQNQLFVFQEKKGTILDVVSLNALPPSEYSRITYDDRTEVDWIQVKSNNNQQGWMESTKCAVDIKSKQLFSLIPLREDYYKLDADLWLALGYELYESEEKDKKMKHRNNK